MQQILVQSVMNTARNKILLQKGKGFLKVIYNAIVLNTVGTTYKWYYESLSENGVMKIHLNKQVGYGKLTPSKVLTSQVSWLPQRCSRAKLWNL